MEFLKVGDLRQWKNDKRVFEILYVGTEKAVHRYINGEKSSHGHIELVDSIHYILNTSISYQEPKPVRKLVAWEIKDGGNISGDIRFTFEGSASSKFNSDRASIYRKLSDEELKELIKGVIGE